MDPLVGTRNCPHLGFEPREGRPCCHADSDVREECGLAIPNPQAQGSAATLGLAPHFCAVLGRDHLPAEAHALASRQKAKDATERRIASKYRPPGSTHGTHPSARHREPIPDPEQPVIPTHTLRNETQRPGPNTPCPCGSKRKFKKCCGRN